MTSHRPDGLESRLLEDIAYGIQHDLWQDRLGRELLLGYEAGVRDPYVVGEICRRADSRRSQVALGRSMPFRRPHLGAGEIEIGTDSCGRSIRLLLAWLNAGMLICGNTGASKSNFIKFLVRQITRLSAVWVSDMYKQEMRHLRALLWPKVDLIVLRPSRMKLNLLQADGDPRLHLAMILDVLRRVLDLPGRAMAIVRSVCHQLYLQFGVYVGSPRGWPTLFDVYERIHAAADLNAAAREAILDRLGAFLVALTPQVGAYRVGWRPSDLAGFRIVFEKRGESELVKSAQLNYLLFSVMYHRIEYGVANTPLNLVIAFEDAQRFFDDRVAEREMTPLDEVAGLIRGSGVSLWCSCQSMAGLSKGLIPNLATKIMGRLGSHQDYQQLGADMAMNPEQIAWAKLNLRPGRLVCQLAEGPWRLPFVARVDEVVVPAVVSDRDADASAAALDGLTTIPADEYQDWQPRHLIELTFGEPSGASRDRLPETHVRFLQIVISHPGEKVSALARLAGVSGKRAAEIRQELREAGYVREHEVATAGRGRNAIILEPLPLAHTAVEQSLP